MTQQITNDTTTRVQKAFVDALGLDGNVDFENLAYGRHEKWDSIGHMALIAELEAIFDIMLDTDDVIGMSSYPVALEILRRYDVPV
jgi:acyl carrier protein